VQIENEEGVSQYAALLAQQAQIDADLRSIITQPKYALPFLQPGRLVSVMPQPDAPAAATAADAASDRVRTSLDFLHIIWMGCESHSV
jgi:ATP-dependent RNA helicase DOB1